MKILIPNATSPKNVGDQAMLESLLMLLHKAQPKAEITIQSVDPLLQKKMIRGAQVNDSLLSWLMFEDPRFFSRVRRSLLFVVQFFLFPRTINAELKQILEAYIKADVIISVGNGGVRSNPGLKQSVILILYLLPFLIAKSADKRVIACPMGFGPYAYPWQSGLSAKVLSDVDTLYLRDPISLQSALGEGLKTAKLSPDHALLFPHMNRKELTGKKSNVIGVVLRNWLPKRLQGVLEDEVVRALSKFTQKTGTQIKLIVQVHAPEHNDRDWEVAKRLYQKLRRANVAVDPPKVLHSPTEATKVYSGCSIVLGMRMHANILAATQYVPFVGIAYEHKTPGIAGMIGMSKYCMWDRDVREDRLLRLLLRAYARRIHIRRRLEKNIDALRTKTASSWIRIFRNL